MLERFSEELHIWKITEHLKKKCWILFLSFETVLKKFAGVAIDFYFQKCFEMVAK